MELKMENYGYVFNNCAVLSEVALDHQFTNLRFRITQVCSKENLAVCSIAEYIEC